jgi:CheY-like chemotaxis protein
MENTSYSILVIEDEELLLRAISKKLISEGYQAITCTSSRQAIDYLKNLERLPDAIWLDYYLGDMNGLEFMNELKKNQSWTNIPVFVVSNSASPQKKSAMLALGAKNYLLKAEHKLDDIIKIIVEFLSQNKSPQTNG